jgi:hypothetical protein
MRYVEGIVPGPASRGAAGVLDRLDAIAVAECVRWPVHLLRLVLGLPVFVAVLVGAGALVGDPALGLREGAPGTLVSAGLLAATGVTAWALHRRAGSGRWHRDFWGLSAAVFAVLVVDELTQATIFVGHWLEREVGATAPGAVRDVDAVLLALLFAACFAFLLPRARVLLAYPVSLALFAIGGLLGAGSQGLDAFVPVSTAEFVAEESLKLLAEPFLLSGYLAALAVVLRRPTRPDSSQQITTSTAPTSQPASTSLG